MEVLPLLVMNTPVQVSKYSAVTYKSAYMLIYRKKDPLLNCNAVPGTAGYNLNNICKDDLVPHFEKKVKEKPKNSWQSSLSTQ